jgi:hypothetical protein
MPIGLRLFLAVLVLTMGGIVNAAGIGGGSLSTPKIQTFEGTLMLVLHSPNHSPNERAHLFELEDTGATIRIKEKRAGLPAHAPTPL